MKKMINDPARANELTFRPKSPRMAVPKNRKATMSTPAAIVEVKGCIRTPFSFISRITGSEPIISITEKRIRDVVRMAAMLNIICSLNLNTKYAK
jgi:hypothetical protein